jgi:hypothetical protein
MFLPLMRCSWPGAYDAGVLSPLGMYNNEQAVLGGETDGYITLFFYRMVRIIKSGRERIPEGCNGLVKRNPVFF